MRAVLSFLIILGAGCVGETPQDATATAGDTAGEIVSAPVSPPTTDEAATIVARSAEFSEYQFTHAAYSLPMQQSAMTTRAREIASRLAKARWIGMDGDGRVVLTQKARSDRRFLVRPNGVVDIVPLAKKEFEVVEAVRANPENQPAVDFRWKWIPNEIGEHFAPRYDGQQYASATLYHDGSQWAVLRIVARGGPSAVD